VNAVCDKNEADRVKAAAAESKRAKEQKTAVSEESETAPAVAAAVTAPPIVEACILCGADSTCRHSAAKFVKHSTLSR
jgi:hypothetical protein